MKWSWTIARVAGIEVRIHATFLLLLLWIGASAWLSEGTVAGVAAGVGFAALLFTIVVLHELGHATAARRFGIRTRDITLLPIGGVARLEQIPSKPREELIVALAGPAVNVVLMGVCAVIAGLGGTALGELGTSVDGQVPLVTRLFWINAALAAFNMVPAFPTDGGRVLRALLAMRMDHHRATRIAARLGQALALVLGFFGLFGNPVLVFIAMFVWLGAAAELGSEELHVAMDGVRVGDAMARELEVLAPWDTLGAAAGRVVAGFQTCFPVVEGPRVVGLLSHDALIRGLAGPGPDAPVSSVMDASPTFGTPDESLERAFERMQRAETTALVVRDGGALVGLLTFAGIGELVVLRGALRGARAAGRNSCGGASEPAGQRWRHGDAALHP